MGTLDATGSVFENVGIYMPYPFLDWEPISRFLDSLDVIELYQLVRGMHDTGVGTDLLNFLGIDEDQWKSGVHSDIAGKIPPELHLLLQNQLQKQVEDKCLRLFNLCTGHDSDAHRHEESSRQVQLAKCKHLPFVVKEKMDNVKTMKLESATLDKEIRQEFKLYFEKCMALVFDLEKLLLHRTFEDSQSRLLFLNYFGTIIGNIYRKLQCMELELRLSLFTGPPGQQLREERETMLAQKEQAEINLGKVEHALRNYQNAGYEFERLASNYTRLIQDIRIVEDDIERMSQSPY
ncbi:hypothetical protein HDV05_004220 [Chytridiales sp. JEL 0842]|nr:hypothetical protein HDV05_004220 [Chytridiales sp. JEL 0842]